MKNYINPMVEITLISAEDVLTASTLSLKTGSASDENARRISLADGTFWG